MYETHSDRNQSAPQPNECRKSGSRAEINAVYHPSILHLLLKVVKTYFSFPVHSFA